MFQNLRRLVIGRQLGKSPCFLFSDRDRSRGLPFEEVLSGRVIGIGDDLLEEVNLAFSGQINLKFGDWLGASRLVLEI